MTDTPQVGRRRVTADVVLQLGGRLANLLLGVVVTVLLVRALGAGAFGQWSTIVALIQITAVFGELGLEQVAVKRAAADREREPEWVGALVSLRLALSLPVTLVSAGLLLVIAEGPEMRIASLVVCATLLIAGLGAVRSVFQLRVRNDISVGLELAHGVLWGLAVVAIAAGGGGIVAFAAAFAVAYAARTVLVVALAVRRVRLRLRGAHRRWRDLARVGVGVGVGTLLIAAYGKIDQVLVFELAGERQAGLYGAVYRLVDAGHFIPLALMTTLFPILAAAHPASPERVQRLLQLSAEYLTMASVPALAFALVAADPLVRVLFGSEFAPSAPALPVLMGAFVLICFGYLAGNMVIVLELQNAFVRYALLALVINVGLNLALVPAYGFMAAAWATLVTEVVVLLLTGRLVLRALDMRPSIGRLPRIAAASTAMALMVWALREAGLPIAGLVVAAVLSYTLALLALRAVERREVMALLRKDPIGL